MRRNETVKTDWRDKTRRNKWKEKNEQTRKKNIVRLKERLQRKVIERETRRNFYHILCSDG